MLVYIFNTSFYVSEQLFDQWNNWVNDELKPIVSSAMPQVSVEVFEVISAEEGESRIFSVQWRCKDLGEIGELDACVAAILELFTIQFKEQITYFSSILKTV